MSKRAAVRKGHARGASLKTAGQWRCAPTSKSKASPAPCSAVTASRSGTAKTYSVDRKLLAELVDPDIRRQVLKERETTRLTVSTKPVQS